MRAGRWPRPWWGAQDPERDRSGPWKAREGLAGVGPPSWLLQAGPALDEGCWAQGPRHRLAPQGTGDSEDGLLPPAPHPPSSEDPKGNHIEHEGFLSSTSL